MFNLRLEQEKRHILHIDADAFFASVEQLYNPDLRGKAVLVGGPSETRGIVSAASYEARAFGIKAGMAMYMAKRKCPQAVVVSGHFERYREVSAQMYKVMTEFTPDVEMASIDEGYLDISGCEAMHGLEAKEVARKLLMKIYRDVGISVSCGMGSSKMVAKVASGLNKPHKLTVVPYGKEREFLAPLALRAMPGIGPRTCEVLERYGLKRLGDLSAMKLEEVYRLFGVQGIPLWKRAQGVDNSVVRAERELPKSISKEHTFYDTVREVGLCLKVLKELSSGIFMKLRKHQMKAKTVTVKIKYKADGHFCSVGFQKHLDLPSAVDGELFKAVKELFLKSVDRSGEIRLVGMGVSGLVRNYNLNLFQSNTSEDLLFEGIDKLRKIYGSESLSYGL